MAHDESDTSFGFGRNLNGITLHGVGFIVTPQSVCLLLLVALSLVFVFTSPITALREKFGYDRGYDPATERDARVAAWSRWLEWAASN